VLRKQLLVEELSRSLLKIGYNPLINKMVKHEWHDQSGNTIQKICHPYAIFMPPTVDCSQFCTLTRSATRGYYENAGDAPRGHPCAYTI